MKIIPRAKVHAFCERFPKARAPLNTLLNEAESANWKKPHDIKSRYRNASILKGGRVVFRIGGNKYRMIVRFDYNKGTGVIHFLGTHKEYDRINAETV